MSVIESFYNKTATVKRKAPGVGDQSKIYSYQTVGSAVPGCLRPITVTAELYDQTRFGYEFRWYCAEASDIEVGDVLVIGGFNYSVEAINFFEDEEDSTENHKRVTVVKTNTTDNPTN